MLQLRSSENAPPLSGVWGFRQCILSVCILKVLTKAWWCVSTITLSYRIHHFATLKILCFNCVYPVPKLSASTDHISVSLASPLPECHTGKTSPLQSRSVMFPTNLMCGHGAVGESEGWQEEGSLRIWAGKGVPVRGPCSSLCCWLSWHGQFSSAPALHPASSYARTDTSKTWAKINPPRC